MPVMTRRLLHRFAIAGFAAAGLVASGAGAQPPRAAAPSIHAKTPKRLIIHNAMVIYGSGKPPYGPLDIILEHGLISSIGSPVDRSALARSSSDTVIDAGGKYVMPGIINVHMHWHEERQPGIPQ